MIAEGRARAYPTLAALGALLVLAPAVAAAQDCAEGRERVEGHCCWPAQTWSTERARCEGAPRCPHDLVEHGDACVAPVGSTAAALASPGATRAPAEGAPDLADAVVPPVYRASQRARWPAREVLGVEELARPVRVRGEDEPLIIAAMAVFDAGWILGWLVVVADEASGGGCVAFFGGPRGSCSSWPFAFIPVGGGMTAGMTTFSGTRNTFLWGLGYGPPSVILQGLGLIAIAIALANETTETGYQPLRAEPASAAAVSLVPGAVGADVGLSLDVRF